MPGTHIVNKLIDNALAQRGQVSADEAVGPTLEQKNSLKARSEQKFNEFIRRKKLNLNSSYVELKYRNNDIGESYTWNFKINPSFVQRERMEERELAWNAVYEAKKNLNVNNCNIIDYFIQKWPNATGLRNTAGLFPLKGTENEKNDLKNDLDFYMNKNKTIAEKQDKFHKYIQGLFDKASKFGTKPRENKEYISQYKEVMEATWPFMTESSTDGTTLFGFSPKQETIDLYKKARAYSQTLTSIYNSKLDMFMDCGYPYFDETDYQKLSEAEGNDLFASCAVDIYGGVTLTSLADLASANDTIIPFKNAGRDTNGKWFIEKYKLDNTMKFFDKTGEINLADVKTTLDNNERVEIVREDGSRQTIELDEFGMQKPASTVVPLYDQEHPETYKTLYKECLNRLNSNTRWYHKSSAEYKNIRKELSRIINKDNVTKEDFKDSVDYLKRQIKTYDDNYAAKTKLDDLTYKRKESVDFTQNIIESMDNALNIDRDLVREASIENARNNMQRQIQNAREEDLVSENSLDIEAGSRNRIDLSEDEELGFLNNKQSHEYIDDQEVELNNDVEKVR